MADSKEKEAPYVDFFEGLPVADLGGNDAGERLAASTALSKAVGERCASNTLVTPTPAEMAKAIEGGLVHKAYDVLRRRFGYTLEERLVIEKAFAKVEAATAAETAKAAKAAPAAPAPEPAESEDAHAVDRAAAPQSHRASPKSNRP